MIVGLFDYMYSYSLTQIQSIGLLLFFFFLFLYKIQKVFSYFKTKNLLTKNKTLKKVKCLSWDDFELLCMELFLKMGWKVVGNAKKGADGGVDLWMQKKSWTNKNVSAIVQCKRYDEALVTIKVIREMYGLMHEYDVDEVYVVTSSRFTKECYAFTKDKNIILIDGKKLISLIRKYA